MLQEHPSPADGSGIFQQLIPVIPSGNYIFLLFFFADVFLFERLKGGKFLFAAELPEESPAGSSPRAFPRGNNGGFFAFPDLFQPLPFNNGRSWVNV